MISYLGAMVSTIGLLCVAVAVRFTEMLDVEEGLFQSFDCDKDFNFVRDTVYDQISLTDECSNGVCDGNPIYGPPMTLERAIDHCQIECANRVANGGPCNGFFFQKHKHGHEVCGFFTAAVETSKKQKHDHEYGAVCLFAPSAAADEDPKAVVIEDGIEASNSSAPPMALTQQNTTSQRLKTADDYVYGEMGVDACPDNYESITDESTCKEAVSFLGSSWCLDGSNTMYCTPEGDSPICNGWGCSTDGGCVKGRLTSEPNGNPDIVAKWICQKAATIGASKGIVVTTATGASDCTGVGVDIVTASCCRIASSIIKKVDGWDGDYKDKGSFSDKPKGCIYMTDVEKYFFNEHSTGSLEAYTSVVCKNSSFNLAGVCD